MQFNHSPRLTYKHVILHVAGALIENVYIYILEVNQKMWFKNVCRAWMHSPIALKVVISTPYFLCVCEMKMILKFNT